MQQDFVHYVKRAGDAEYSGAGIFSTRSPQRRNYMAEVKLTKSNFESEVLHSDKPVLVDFWASWCGPCQMLGPVISEIAEEKGDAVKVGKVNVDEEPELSKEFSVMSIPTLVLFKNGKAEKTSVGYIPKDKVLEFIS